MRSPTHRLIGKAESPDGDPHQSPGECYVSVFNNYRLLTQAARLSQRAPFESDPHILQGFSAHHQPRRFRLMHQHE